ncbi:hypothetical protein [Gracilibacillus alcaliphilus]|uniref:hypothetical protein n=1 Tax=Gracilibacillus alcaliphilus TaxID=1401441 RepID=UPI00195CC816|nr:hypothetical protein [Gracilibacillus alcaliphilus]MBM7677069.1 hypothetical protein [Gracilibacillus alcaliphilus]
MYKSVQAFFKSENDAEKARAALNGLKTNHILVDTLPEDSETLLLSPLGYTRDASSSIGPMGTAGPASGGILPVFDRISEETDDEEPRGYMVDFEVDEEDFQEALRVLMENDGYVNRNRFGS